MATIPLSWSDPLFSDNVNSGSVTVPKGGTLSNVSITQTGSIASVVLAGGATLDDIRISSREGVRIGGSGNININDAYIEATGQPGDHADSIQAYAPGASGTVTITNTEIVAHSGDATAGMFVADAYTGTFVFDNVVFNGGPYGLRIANDGPGEDYVSLTNVYFVGPFAYGALLFQEVNAPIHITHWENVRYATIENGVLVPGALIQPPWPVEGGDIGAPTIDNFSTDSGTAGDHITNDTTLALIGTAAANSTVKVFEGTTQVGQTTANGSGAWSVTTAALPDGSHSFTATSTTGGTTSSSSLPLTVRVDTIAPSAPTIALFSTDTGTVGDGITSDNTLTLNGAAAANSAVKVYDGTMLLGTAAANSSGAWSYTTGALSNATHSLTATATDAAGNISVASSVLAVTVNTAGTGVPTIAMFSSDSGTVGDGITNDNTLTLSGIAAANSAVTVFDGTMQIGQTTANGNGAWSYTTVALAEGSHGLTVTDADGASAMLPVTIDRIAPERPVVSSFSPDTAPTGDHQTTATTMTLTGTGEAGSTVKTFDGSVMLGSALVNASGIWSFTASGLAVGDHNFTANDTDAAGNTSATSTPLTVTIDSGGEGGGTSNLVINGGFETGDFTGWSVGTYQPEQILITSNAHSGNFATALGPAGSDGSLSENLATVAGQHYTLHFSLANMSPGSNDFSVHWDGTSVFALVDAPSQSFTDYTFDVVATDNSTHLEFNFRQDPTQWRLDDVSVVATGTSQPPPATGTSGNDVLKGTTGGDLLAGGNGDDTYTVNSTGDKVIELVNGGTDNVETTISYTLPSNVENLQLTDGGEINGTGNDLNNVINGNDSPNLLEGNAGNDTLNGRGGEDTLLGGSGNDVFQFSSQYSADGDQVLDFVHGVDKLDFSKIDASASRRGDQSFTFDGYTDGGRGGHLWAVEDQSADVTHVYGQTGGFQFHIDLQGMHLGLTASDFIL